jgi:hypothetical protein
MWTPPTHHEYNPWNLPSKMDFHKATADLPLPRPMKVRFQNYLASKDRKQIKQIIADLENLENDIFTKSGVNPKEAGYKNGGIILPKSVQEHERKYITQMAILARASKEFAEKYLQSLVMQHKA